LNSNFAARAAPHDVLSHPTLLSPLQHRTGQHLPTFSTFQPTASSHRTTTFRILISNMETGPSNAMFRYYNSSGRYTILTGLIGEVQLEPFRNAMADGTLKPYPTLKVKEVLKAVAKTLHEQMTFTPQYRRRVCSIQPGLY
jgi:hypothetical protein